MKKHKTGLKSREVSKQHFSSGTVLEEIFTGITVRVREGKNLLASDVETGKSDPVCFVWCGYTDIIPDWQSFNNPDSGILITKVCPVTIDPIWNEDVKFPLELIDLDSLRQLKVIVSVKDVDDDPKADCGYSYDDLGYAEIGMEELIRSSKPIKNTIVSKPLTFTLKKSSGMKRVDGTIKLSFVISFLAKDVEPLYPLLGADVTSVDKFAAEMCSFVRTGKKNNNLNNTSGSESVASSVRPLSASKRFNKAPVIRGRPSSANSVAGAASLQGTLDDFSLTGSSFFDSVVEPESPVGYGAVRSSIDNKIPSVVLEDGMEEEEVGEGEIAEVGGVGEEGEGFDWEDDALPGYTEQEPPLSQLQNSADMENKNIAALGKSEIDFLGESNLMNDRLDEIINKLNSTVNLKGLEADKYGSNENIDELLLGPLAGDQIIPSGSTTAENRGSDEFLHESNSSKKNVINPAVDKTALPSTQSKANSKNKLPLSEKDSELNSMTLQSEKLNNTDLFNNNNNSVSNTPKIQGNATIAIRILRELAAEKRQTKELLEELTRITKRGVRHLSQKINNLETEMKSIVVNSQLNKLNGKESGAKNRPEHDSLLLLSPTGGGDELLPPSELPQQQQTDISSKDAKKPTKSKPSQGKSGMKEFRKLQKQQLANNGNSSNAGGMELVLKGPGGTKQITTIAPLPTATPEDNSTLLNPDFDDDILLSRGPVYSGDSLLPPALDNSPTNNKSMTKGQSRGMDGAGSMTYPPPATPTNRSSFIANRGGNNSSNSSSVVNGLADSMKRYSSGQNTSAATACKVDWNLVEMHLEIGDISTCYSHVLEVGSMEELHELMKMTGPQLQQISMTLRNRLFESIAVLLQNDEFVERCLIWLMALLREENNRTKSQLSTSISAAFSSSLAAHVRSDLSSSLLRVSLQKSKKGLLASLLCNKLFGDVC